MKQVMFKTAWGKVLKGIEYDTFEFVDYLGENLNANNIWVDEDERKIVFTSKNSKYYEFHINDIEFIIQYIEEGIRFWNFYYQVKTENKLSEFSISSHIDA